MDPITIGTLLATIAPAVLPAVIDGFRMVIGKITGGDLAAPKSTAEVVELERLGIEKLKAMAEIDKPYGEISRWVSNLRSSFRYIAVGGIELAYLMAELSSPTGASANLAMLAGQALFFIIGDRVYLGVKKGIK